MATSGIYVILNTKSGKVYIGKTARNFKVRWGDHKTALRGGYHDNIYLQRAWNKYGEKLFKFCILEHCPVEQLNEREKHHIAIYKARGLCYNLTDGGDGLAGMVFTPEHRRKMSEAQKGKALTEEHRHKLSEVQKGRVITPEHRRKIGEALKGKKKPPRTEETRRKMSEAKKGSVHTEETRRKIGEAQKGKVLTEEHKRKLSEAAKQWHATKRTS
jgi:group I intron endonuclease